MTRDDHEMRAEGEELLKSVEHVDGKPVIISRYGFRVVELNGKKYVVAATPDELATQRAAHFNRSLEEAKKEVAALGDVPACGGTGPFHCFPYNGCKQCYAQYIGSGVYQCTCSGT